MRRIKQQQSVRTDLKPLVSDKQFLIISSTVCSSTFFISCLIALLIEPNFPRLTFSRKELDRSLESDKQQVSNSPTLSDIKGKKKIREDGDDKSSLYTENAYVDWLKLEAKQHNGDIILMWLNSAETFCKHYIVERSFDKVSFNPISNTKIDGGKDRYHSYVFTDEGISDNTHDQIFYRIRHVGRNGKIDYSKMVSIDVSEKDVFVEFLIYPNPATDTLIVSLAGPYYKNITINIYSIHNELIDRRAGNITDYEFLVKDWPSGTYEIEILGLTKDVTQSIIKY